MKKLKLDLDTLPVESFETAAVHPGARGTVRGRDAARAFTQAQGTASCPPFCHVTVIDPNLTVAAY